MHIGEKCDAPCAKMPNETRVNKSEETLALERLVALIREVHCILTFWILSTANNKLPAYQSIPWFR